MKVASGSRIWSSLDEGDSESVTKYNFPSNEKNWGASEVKTHFEWVYLKRNFLLSWRSMLHVTIINLISVYFNANSSRVKYTTKISNYRLVEFCQYTSSDFMSPLKATDSAKTISKPTKTSYSLLYQTVRPMNICICFLISHKWFYKNYIGKFFHSLNFWCWNH